MAAQLKVKPMLSRSTNHSHNKFYDEFDVILVRDFNPKHPIDNATRRKVDEGVAPSKIKSDLLPVSAVFGVARIVFNNSADPEVIQR